MKSAAKQRELSEPIVRADEQNKRAVRLSEPEVRAYELLKNFGIPAKNFSFELHVSERYVQLMASGEKPIQGWMVKQILEVGEELLWKQKEQIDAYMRRAMKDQFGRVE